MKKQILTTAIAAAAALTFAVPAQAGEKGHDKDWFKTADTDADGSLTLAEFQAAKGDKMDEAKVKEKFAMMDADKDSKVSKDEAEAAMKKRGNKDKDHAHGAGEEKAAE